MRRHLIIGGLAAAAIAATACTPPPVAHHYPACPTANGEVIFTVRLPVLFADAYKVICTPGGGQRVDVLVPPAQPGDLLTPVEQINAMGGVAIANWAGDPTGYTRGRTVDVDRIPVASSALARP